MMTVNAARHDGHVLLIRAHFKMQDLRLRARDGNQGRGRQERDAPNTNMETLRKDARAKYVGAADLPGRVQGLHANATGRCRFVGWQRGRQTCVVPGHRQSAMA